jgi:hypothetical protein
MRQEAGKRFRPRPRRRPELAVGIESAQRLPGETVEEEERAAVGRDEQEIPGNRRRSDDPAVGGAIRAVRGGELPLEVAAFGVEGEELARVGAGVDHAVVRHGRSRVEGQVTHRFPRVAPEFVAFQIDGVDGRTMGDVNGVRAGADSRPAGRGDLSGGTAGQDERQQRDENPRQLSRGPSERCDHDSPKEPDHTHRD